MEASLSYIHSELEANLGCQRPLLRNEDRKINLDLKSLDLEIVTFPLTGTARSCWIRVSNHTLIRSWGSCQRSGSMV